MVYLLKAFANLAARPVPPQRRRTIIIGAGPTGISAAFHLGEHALLLERRPALEEPHDLSHHYPLGASRGGALGPQGRSADIQRPGASAAERNALFIACSSTSKAAAATNNLIHIARWQPPLLAPAHATDDEFYFDEQCEASPLRALVPLLRGEILFGASVVRVSPSLHLLELADGRQFVYDKLLCTVPLPELTSMIAHELASRISHDEFLRGWLAEQDIEVADRPTQVLEGDIDELAAGKRMAARINRALAERFPVCRARHPGPSLFLPRLVQAITSATP
jgi:hypothetical protein